MRHGITALTNLWVALCLLAVGCGGGGSGGGASLAPVNTTVEVSLDPLTAPQSGSIALVVVLRDGEGDSVDLVIEFSLDGVSFAPVTLTGTSPSLTGLAADADGESYTFTWDSVADGVATAAPENSVTIRLTASDLGGLHELLSGVFRVDNTIPTAPALTTVSPTAGPGGTPVTIEGVNLGIDPAAVEVRFGPFRARVTSLVTGTTPGPSGFPSTLEVVAPPEVGTGAIEVDLSGAATLTGPLFHGAPRIVAITPAFVVEGQGDLLEIRGAVLDDGSIDVVFNDGAQSVTVAPSQVAPDTLVVPFPGSLSAAPGGTPVAVQVVHDGGPSNTVGVTLVTVPLGDMAPAVTSLNLPLRSVGGLLPVQLTLFDSGTTDLADLNLELSLDGSSFQPLTLAAGNPPIVALPASRVTTGARLTFIWDSATDIPGTFEGAVRVRAGTTESGGGTPGPVWTGVPVWIDAGVAANLTVTESFDTNDNESPADTTADWNGAGGTPFGTPGELVGLATAEPPWGDGSDGDFQPTASVILTTDGVDPVYGGLDGVYRFSSFVLDPGIELSVVGSHPLDIRVDGPAEVNGSILLAGSPGMPGTATSGGAGGLGVAGGSDGGAGGFVSANAVVDGSTVNGGGHGGRTSVSAHAGAVGGGGGGAGLDQPGGDGASGIAPGSGAGGQGGLARGVGNGRDLSFGRGGGGGGGNVDATGSPAGGGGGGGSGGGTLLLTAAGNVTIGATIDCDGGAGGDGFATGSGGGGSGGVIRVRTSAAIMFQDGVDLSALGGAGGGTAPLGGDGSRGRIELLSPQPVLLPGPGLPNDFDPLSPGPGDPGFTTGSFTAASFEPGTGIDGTFAPQTDVVLTTDGVDPTFGGNDGIYQFDSITIPAGVTVSGSGSNPLVLRATGDIVLNGTVNVTGGDALTPPILPPTPGVGGPGGPGGGAGGMGGFYDFGADVSVSGSDGDSPTILPVSQPNPAGLGAATVPFLDPDPPGPVSSAGGGGGAGGALPGSDGSNGLPPFGTPGGAGGPASGALDFRDTNNPDTIVLQGGAGGGGGGGNINDSGIFGPGTPGGGGGGGGGMCQFVSGARFTLGASGLVDASGGNGASANVTGIAGNGGGGSGGGVLVQGQELSFEGGAILAVGGISPAVAGTPGGAGAPGRIRLESPSNAAATGTITPTAFVGGFDASLLFSVARSIAIPLGVAELRAFERSITGSTLTPDPQPSPATVIILWGVWQARLDDLTTPVDFSGFVSDPALLPPGEFIQFQVLIESPTTPPLPGSVDLLSLDHE